MKQIAISIFAFFALMVLLISGIPKRAEVKNPPDLETAWLAFSATVDAYFDARNNNGDTITTKYNLQTAYNYLKTNWTVSQVDAHVNERWPTYQQLQANCLMQCKRQYYSCNNEYVGYPPGAGTCDEDYETCKAGCH
jgi:hypothetical protein